jgi:signal transduction histidine kinase
VDPLLAFILGGCLVALVLLPLSRAAAHRATLRTREAERRARGAERLAELGSMTGGLAHEIKNPLSTVLLNAQLLREGIADAELAAEERERFLRRIDALMRECERLRGILEDFLRFAGRVKLSRTDCDLSEIVEEMTDFFLPQARQAAVTLRSQLPAEHVVAEIDPALFKQAVLNLMINAVQAMEGMAVESTGDAAAPPRELMLRLLGPDEEDVIRLHVIDTGPGIDPERLDAIFHPYVSARRGGTGLGLPTARRIIEEHGGRVRAFSEIGRGSDFVIEVPRSAPPTPATAEPGAADG